MTEYRSNVRHILWRAKSTALLAQLLVLSTDHTGIVDPDLLACLSMFAQTTEEEILDLKNLLFLKASKGGQQ